MVGKYEIEIYDNRIHYQFEIKRNITIIQGDSATGKTALIRLIADYQRLGKGSGITLICDKKCIVLNSLNWESVIRSTHDQIFFVDEDQPFVRSGDFANAVKGSDNYFVIIYRDSLPRLAYSIDEIYGIREDKKYSGLKKTYNEVYKLYNLEEMKPISPEVVIVEDSNSGYEFFSHVFVDRCVSAGGKSRVAQMTFEQLHKHSSVLSIVDGAAFGSEIREYLRRVRHMEGKAVLYAPESFEYLVLISEIVNVDRKKTEETYEYADSVKYESWEQYYTDCLMELTADDRFLRYSKHKLRGGYLAESNMNRLKEVLPSLILS